MLCLLTVICLIWFITVILQVVKNKTYQGTAAADIRQTSSIVSEVKMNNFIVRFLYEVFFELMICAFINLTDVEASGHAQWFASLAIIILGAMATLAIFCMFFANGPYVRDTFAPGSLLASFWGHRNLHEEVLKAALAQEELKTIGLSKQLSIKSSAALASSVSQSHTLSI